MRSMHFAIPALLGVAFGVAAMYVSRNSEEQRVRGGPDETADVAAATHAPETDPLGTSQSADSRRRLLRLERDIASLRDEAERPGREPDDGSKVVARDDESQRTPR
jgi:hypothetical protein